MEFVQMAGVFIEFFLNPSGGFQNCLTDADDFFFVKNPFF
jgi:hypothetical protein